MLSKRDKAEIISMINSSIYNLRKELWASADFGHTDRATIKSDVTDNTEAILELSELIPTEEVE